jgi:hypothetical protein
MILSEIHILPTENTPEIILSPEGIIKIKGRAVTVYNPEFIKQVIEWIEAYLNNPPRTTYITIAFEYINSYGTTILLGILKKLLEVNLQSKMLDIKWYYEEDDEDTFERGQYIASALNVSIKFIIVRSIAKL